VAHFVEHAGLLPLYSNNDPSNLARIGRYMAKKIVGRTWQVVIGDKATAVELKTVAVRPRLWCIAVLNGN
jgi:hypothetical protein